MIQEAIAELLREWKYDNPELYQSFLRELQLSEITGGDQ